MSCCATRDREAAQLFEIFSQPNDTVSQKLLRYSNIQLQDFMLQNNCMCSQVTQLTWETGLLHVALHSYMCCSLCLCFIALCSAQTKGTTHVGAHSCP